MRQKEDLAESKNNSSDSGVSSEDCVNNSNSLRIVDLRSFSTTNCNLSSILEYSSHHKNLSLSEEFTRYRNIMNEYQANQSMSAASNVMKLSDEYTNLAQDTLRCPICALTTSNRSELTEHLMSHCTSTQNNSNLKAILEQLPVLESLYGGGNCSFLIQGEHTKHKTEKIDKPDHRVSRANPQGNIRKQGKSLREGKTCKQCSFVANTKMDYWEHMRCHIKGFNCSECSFVTKYKHHMNHHWLSVHDGSKPFKCKKCSYTCVSKSMLTSHSKKHSNIYPYRCANCTYKTKFCNALKKHLRKKEHQPAMVLNADGSPNPLCIIDVYSTKRGPKQKPSIKNQDELSQQSTNMTINDNQLDSAVTSPVSSYQSPVARYLNVTALNGMNSANGISQNAMNQNQPVMTFPYSDLVAAFNLSNHLLLRDNATFHENMHKTDHLQSDHSQSDHSQSDILMEYTKAMKKEDEMPAAFVENSSKTCFDVTDAKESYNVTSKPSTIVPLKSQLEIQEDESTAAPLDLRITEVIGKDQIQLQPSVTNSPKVTSTSRRKGRAMKLERRVVEEDTDEIEFSEFSAASRSGSRVENEIKDTKDKKFADLSDSELICHYCEIAFVNAIMYTVHMGYHGFADPYTCNMCGHQCIDKLSFFLHIGRSEHHTRFDRGERSCTS